MTAGHVRASSAGMVADAFATFLDDGFRLRTDAITARRRLVASLFAVATPLIDGGGRRVTEVVERAGAAVWRGARKTEQVGASVADEAADAGREGARAVRDAAAARRDDAARGRAGGPARGRRTPQVDDIDVVDDIDAVDDVMGVVEVVEVVEPTPTDTELLAAESLMAAELADAEGVLDTGDADELDIDELEVDEAAADDDLLGEGLPAEETVPEPPAVLTDATEIGGDRGQVADTVTEEVVEQITGDDAPARRAGRRATSPRPRTGSRPARREQPREERRETASNGSRERRG